MTDGLVVVDKPAGWTSHDVVARARRIAGTRKVGHAGTLDPMATGVLILGIGRATRLLGHLSLHDKDYLATIRLGTSTVTDDAEGEVTAQADASAVEDAQIAKAVARLTGDISQVPSSVSAIKVDGQRAYAAVRAGKEVELKARPVHVARFDVLERRGDDLDVAVTCSTGTYVRALARDLGGALGVGAHLTALRRTRIGTFAEMVPLAEPLGVLSLEESVGVAFPRRALTEAEASDLRYGRPVPLSHVEGVVGAFAPEGEVLALLEDRDGLARPVLVLRPNG